MACSSPITQTTERGNITIRCKQCLGCRIYTQSSLTLQCLLEKHTAASAEFWTLTYAKDPETGDWKDFQKFINRLRMRNSRMGNPLPVRYLGCGEYGTRSGRFHYHALIYNNVQSTKPDALIDCWPLGHYTVGTVTPASVRYTCGYTMKFPEPGKEPLSGRSVRPVLGAIAMQQLGAKYKAQNHKLAAAPSILKWEGSTYPLNRSMQISFMEGYDPTQIVINAAGTKMLNRSSVQAITEHRTLKIIGDPLEAYRKKQERILNKSQRESKNNGKL